MRYLTLVKPLLMFVAALIGVVMGGRQVYIYLTEKQPTVFTAENFAATYRGQQWISVTGRPAVEALAEMPNHGPGRFANVFVPLVPQNWQRPDPVHVVLAPSEIPAGGVNAWAQAAEARGEVTITGMVRPLGGLNYGYVFPRLKFASPTVTINENAAPQPPLGMGIFMAICVVLCAISGWWIFRILRT